MEARSRAIAGAATAVNIVAPKRHRSSGGRLAASGNRSIASVRACSASMPAWRVTKPALSTCAENSLAVAKATSWPAPLERMGQGAERVEVAVSGVAGTKDSHEFQFLRQGVADLSRSLGYRAKTFLLTERVRPPTRTATPTAEARSLA